ncbi:MAG: DUF4175 family protein [Ignavibacteriae bacterium]|nr:DUF4175 family protein [Ignavibacteriota bacterium]MCB9217514.1 DUF4175 family protein [Ignavibacteria bacterium]
MTIHTLYTSLTAKIARVRKAEQFLSLQTGFINVLAGLIAVWTLAGVMEMIVEFGVTGRTILFWGSALVSLAILAKTIAGPLGRVIGLITPQTDETIARRVGGKIPAVGDRLVNTLQLYRTVAAGVGSSPGVSIELAEASIITQGRPLVDHDYSVILEKEDRRRALLLLFSSALLCGALFFTFGDRLTNAYTRLADYSTFYQKPAPFALGIEPGNLRVVKGDSVEITVRASGIPPRTVTLSIAEDGSDQAEEYELREVEPGLYRHLIPNIRRNTRYSAEAAGVATEEYGIAVVERPELRDMVVTVIPPSYTGRRPEKLPEGYGDLSGLRGTQVRINLTTSIPVTEAEIVQLFPRGGAVAASISVESAGSELPSISYDTVRMKMVVNGTEISGGFSLIKSGEYYISVKSAEGLQNLSPIHYTMSVSTDGSPSIVLLQPSADVEVDETMLLPTQLRISDDYGFSKLRIMYRLTASKYEEPWSEFREQVIPIPKGASTGIEIPYLWDMTKSRLVPEDELEIYFEVFDNDRVGGPKSARTGSINVRFPSFEELLQEAETIQDKATADLENLLKEADKARRDMEQLDRELSKQLAQQKREANWQEKQKLQELIQQHEGMQQKLEQLAEDMRTMAEKLQEAKAISPETLQKYQELQKLFQEVKDPKLMESMQKMGEQMQKMTPEQMAEAMRNYKFNEEQFKQAIERTKKILERMMTQQQVDELVRRSEKLSQEQKELNQEMQQMKEGDKGGEENLAKRQEELAEQAERLQERAEELSQSMKEQQNMPTEAMEGAQQKLEKSNPSGKMQQSSQQMRSGQKQQAQQGGEQAQQSLEEFSQQMKEMREQMKQNDQRQVMNKMRKSLKDLLDLSKQQEELRNKTDQTSPNSPSFRDLAREQSELREDMKNLANQISEIGEQSFAVTPEMGRELGNAMQKMGEAQQSLENRSSQSASRQEGDAMGSMNKGAMMMAQQLQKMGEGEGEGQGEGMGMGSFQQRLQQLAAQQQMINMAMGQQQGQGQGEGQGEDGKQGKKGKDGQGGEGGEENGGEGGVAQRLTRQQQEVKKSLDQLNKEAKESGGTQKNMVGDLERAAKEIEEVLRDMQSGQISDQTLRRQEQILSRMLDAMKSQRERDMERKRESTPGKDVVRNSPPELRFQNDPATLDELRQNLEDGRQGYSRDYEYLIRKYFESLGE